MNTKKIGIITLVGYKNYGNRLQNYALKYTLEKMDFEVNSLKLDMPASRNTKVAVLRMRINNLLKGNIIKKIKKSISKNKVTNEIYFSKERYQKFKEFSDSYLNEMDIQLSSSNDKKELDKFDYFVVGSDQVWNPGNMPELDKFFLTFAEPAKRIAYSASFGSSSIPWIYQKNFSRWLREMRAISVRELAGKDLVFKLINKEVDVLVDPTMLLSKEEWSKLSARAINRPNNSYLLTYFLGTPTDEEKHKIEKIALDKNMSVINLGDINDKITFETGPSEFLDYINNASAFFTDSFHGVVFSILFQTPFVVYERNTSGESMYSRIDTLLHKFNFKDREYKAIKNNIFDMDFTYTEKILLEEKKKAFDYLKNVLE